MSQPLQIAPERLATLRASARQMDSKLGGVINDPENLQVLAFTRGQLDIAETVIAIPMSLILMAASQVMGQISAPTMAQAENMKAKAKFGKSS